MIDSTAFVQPFQLLLNFFQLQLHSGIAWRYGEMMEMMTIWSDPLMFRDNNFCHKSVGALYVFVF